MPNKQFEAPILIQIIMIKILGTGNANVTKCYNTCFAINNKDEWFLIDGGGGNQILDILQKSNIKLSSIHNIFVSHSHTDHILGIIWVIRMIGTQINKNKYQGNLNIYCHKELSEALITICNLTLAGKITKLFGERIIFNIVDNNQTKEILGWNIEFFDIGSTKLKQFGFKIDFNNSKTLTYVGDEPCRESLYKYAENSTWLLHEAFCLYSEKDEFKPYEKHHTTVKEACETAEKLNVKNLILYHTEDKNIDNRKKLYTQEGKEFYNGNLFVPNDGDEILL